MSTVIARHFTDLGFSCKLLTGGGKLALMSSRQKHINTYTVQQLDLTAAILCNVKCQVRGNFYRCLNRRQRDKHQNCRRKQAMSGLNTILCNKEINMKSTCNVECIYMNLVLKIASYIVLISQTPGKIEQEERDSRNCCHANIS